MIRRLLCACWRSSFNRYNAGYTDTVLTACNIGATPRCYIANGEMSSPSAYFCTGEERYKSTTVIIRLAKTDKTLDLVLPSKHHIHLYPPLRSIGSCVPAWVIANAPWEPVSSQGSSPHKQERTQESLWGYGYLSHHTPAVVARGCLSHHI